MTLGTLNYGNYRIFLIMGNAGFISSTLSPDFRKESLLPLIAIRKCILQPLQELVGPLPHAMVLEVVQFRLLPGGNLTGEGLGM